MPPLMSAITPKADIGPQSLHVRFGSLSDICNAQSNVRSTLISGPEKTSDNRGLSAAITGRPTNDD